MTAGVSLSTVAPRPTAIVSQTTTWQQFPSACKPLSRSSTASSAAAPSWEIYGHWREDAGELETEIYYLLQRPPPPP